MKFIINGTDMKKKKVGGNKYGYLYLPKEWIGSMVTVIKHETNEVSNPQKSKKFQKMKLFAIKKLEREGYEISDTSINIEGRIKHPLLIGTKGSRMVVVSASPNKIIKSGEIDKDLSSAANVVYMVINDDARFSDKAMSKIKKLANVKVWRCPR